MANKNVLRANRKLNKAVGGFTKAVAQVAKVEELLRNDIETVGEAINQLIDEREESEAALERASEVKAKLAEFVI